MIDPKELALLKDALDTLADGYAGLPDFHTQFDAEAVASVLQQTGTVQRRKKNRWQSSRILWVKWVKLPDMSSKPRPTRLKVPMSHSDVRSSLSRP